MYKKSPDKTPGDFWQCLWLLCGRNRNRLRFCALFGGGGSLSGDEQRKYAQALVQNLRAQGIDISDEQMQQALQYGNDLVENDLLGLGIPVIALDSGNDNQGGQVILYANAPVTHQEPMGQPEQGMLPTMLQCFPELDKIVDDNPGLVMNCADNAESEPQAMMANVRNGELLALITNRLLEAGSVPGNLWRSDILTGNTRCTFTGFYHKEESSNG